MAEQPEPEPGCADAHRRRPAPAATELPQPEEHLEELAGRLAAASAHWPEIARRASRLAERIATQRFYIAVLGEFKRGKSTLVNALIGHQLLPSGVIPLTTVATEVHFGSSQTTAVFADGYREAISADTIADYVTEPGNPSNIKEVDRVEVGTSTILGTPGLVLVDTPGIASVNPRNTTAAHAALLDSDAAVVVLSADSPLSHSELEILVELRDRRAKVFVVINKADHLTDLELDQARSFVAHHLQRTFDNEVQPYCISARSVLETGAGSAGQQFEAFQDAIRGFVVDDLAAARRTSARRELGRLARSLAQSLQIEAAAETMDAHALSAQIERFASAASTGRHQLDEDLVILDHDIAALAADIGRELSGLAREAAHTCLPSLAARSASLGRRQLDAGLRDAIESCVRQRFETLRRDVQDQLEQAWQAAAARFAGRTQARVDELVNVANELFAVHLPDVAIPAVAAQPERFWYLFLNVGRSNAVIGRLLGLLLPSGIARGRALRRSERRLVEEFDKHAGRARHDLAERLAAAQRQLVWTMVAEFNATRESLLAAAEGARNLLAMTDEQRRQRDGSRHDLRVISAALRAEAGTVTGVARSP